MNNSVLEIDIKSVSLRFKTKPGVFAKHGLDDGSRLLLENLKVEDETLIADLGSGSGIMGFYCAKLNPHGHVHLLDDHLRAIELAKENLDLNQLKNVEVYLSDLFSAVPNRTYHLIVSNPPQQMGNEFLQEVVMESSLHLKAGGRLVLVVKNNLRKVIQDYLNKYIQEINIIATGREHCVIESIKL